MELSILKKRTIRQRLRLWVVISFGFLPAAFAQSRKIQNIHTDTTVNDYRYISAFTSISSSGQSEKTTLFPAPERGYTIQICTLCNPLKDVFFQGEYVIRYVKMGDLYRYIFAACYTLEQARQKLKTVRPLFPQACIREYHQGLLGQIVDIPIQP